MFLPLLALLLAVPSTRLEIASVPTDVAPLACERPVFGSFAFPRDARDGEEIYTSVAVRCATDVAYRLTFTGDCFLSGPNGERVPFEVRGGPGYATPLVGCGLPTAWLEGVGSQTFLLHVRRTRRTDLRAGEYRSDLDVRIDPR